MVLPGLASFLALAAGCGDDAGIGGDDDDDDNVVQPTFSAIYANVLSDQLRCLRCHDSTETDEVLQDFYEQSGELDFVTQETAYDQLVNEIADGDESCAGRTLVVPGQPDESLLLEKVASDDPSCGDPMPLLQEPIADAEVEAIRTWILDGALND